MLIIQRITKSDGSELEQTILRQSTFNSIFACPQEKISSQKSIISMLYPRIATHLCHMIAMNAHSLIESMMTLRLDVASSCRCSNERTIELSDIAATFSNKNQDENIDINPRKSKYCLEHDNFELIMRRSLQVHIFNNIGYK